MRSATLKNQKGTSLVSVMVLGGIISLMALAAAQAFSDRVKGAEFIRGRQDLNDLMERVRMSSVAIESCSSMLPPGTTLVSGGTSPLASIDIGSEVISMGANGNINVTQMNLVGDGNLPNTFDSAGVARTHLRTHLEIVGKLMASGRVYDFKRNFAFDVLTDGANVITGCYRGQNIKKVACETMAGAGAFVPLPEACNMPPLGPTLGACPAGQCIGGFDQNNIAVCRPM